MAISANGWMGGTLVHAYRALMRTSWMWRAMWAGLVAGTVMVAGGGAVGTELGALAAGYGSLIIVAALYLGAGLAIRQRVWRSWRTFRVSERPSGNSVLGHRVF
jgi:high-affinity Fe2+/Pb2+ permease